MVKIRVLKSRAALVLVAVLVLSGTYLAASAATKKTPRPDVSKHATQSVRAIALTPSGGSGADSMNISFSQLLPGTPQRVSISYKNTGSSPETVWVVFPNATALSALNSLGQYGAVHLLSTGPSAVGDVFDSTYLDDNSTTCGSFSVAGCWPLLSQYKLNTSLAPRMSGTFSFEFEFASAYNVQPTSAASAQWNRYPIDGQSTLNASDGSGSGLPYELVALQPGIKPGQPATIIQRHPFGQTITAARSGDQFSDRLKVEGPEATVGYTVTSPNKYLNVSSAGWVTTVGGPLPVGTYTVSGTDTDSSNDTGTWTYTLTVVAS